MDRDFGDLALMFYAGKALVVILAAFGLGVLIGWVLFG